MGKISAVKSKLEYGRSASLPERLSKRKQVVVPSVREQVVILSERKRVEGSRAETAGSSSAAAARDPSAAALRASAQDDNMGGRGNGRLRVKPA